MDAKLLEFPRRRTVASIAADSSPPTAPHLESPIGHIRSLGGPTRGSRFPIYDRVVIGRSAKCDLLLTGEGVSRYHAQLVADRLGRVVLVDMNSANGVYMQGERVLCQILVSGDLFTIEDNVFVFEAARELPEATSPRAERRALDGPVIAEIMRYRVLRLRAMRSEPLSATEQEHTAALGRRLRSCSTSGREVRRFRRFDCDQSVDVHVAPGQTLLATLTDISAEGAGFRCSGHQFREGTVVQLVFGVGHDTERYTVAASVRWVQDDRVGVVFAGAPEWYTTHVGAPCSTIRIDSLIDQSHP